MKRITTLSLLIVTLFMLIACDVFNTDQASGSTDTTTTASTEPINHTEFYYYDPFKDDKIITPEKSTFFSTVYIEDASSYNTFSDGDLWPSTWSDDGNLYLANGDGKGFNLSAPWQDIVLSKITLGTPDERNIQGVKINPSTQLSQVWNETDTYNRKPTSMISANGVLYLAVQDLGYVPGAALFNGVPSATIIRSEDKGQTWTWDTTKPMFDDYNFTTVMFLDYGQDLSNNTFDEYVYAYGLDYNWRYSASGNVPDPVHLYLARIPKEEIQDITSWEFYTGDLDGNATWSIPGDIEAKKTVLTDERKVYGKLLKGPVRGQSPLAQSSIVYNKTLNRYIYTSWTEYTFEFYESPTPWGPWKHFFSREYVAFDNSNKWITGVHGGYATVIPSKYISEDGKTMWVNSNTFMGGVNVYKLSFRKLIVNPYEQTIPTNEKANVNLSLSVNSINPTPISLATKMGLKNKLNDGRTDIFDESFNNARKTIDFWGMTWSQAYNMNEIVYKIGKVSSDGGWFEKFKVQVRQNQEWIDVENLEVSDNYTYDKTLETSASITIRFDETWGDGVRIIGIPGGIKEYTSISEFEVYYK
ncbi:MAG: hypothetical protein K0Q49_1184 [Haloplasmataceae bacterium]|nr:hypothetical protein [Haloplasmataceae bacterium]